MDRPCDDRPDNGNLESQVAWAEFAALLPDPLFVLGDWPGVPRPFQGRPVFKQSCSRDDDTIPFFYHVQIDREPHPIRECRFRTGFCGDGTSHAIRREIPAAIVSVANHSTYCVVNDRPWWELAGRDERRKTYLDLLVDTQFPLCPRGHGLTSIRFFESLRLGRIPVLVADDTKLPLPRLIDWDRICMRVPENRLAEFGPRLDDWLAGHDLEAASAEARRVSLEYFQDTEKFIRISLEQ